ncbi:MAG: D-alanyl-D-alanine carboxypeptidase [Ruminococcaceae bacterium]|nr:D-alanyl-D-alanine carboxypeptidase [Oscillospiraceae bacterium]
MKNRSEKSFKVLYLCGLISAFLSFLILMPKSMPIYLNSSPFPDDIFLKSSTSEKLDPRRVSLWLDDELYAKNAYLCSIDTRSVIAEKSSDVRVSPASLTKIMTAIVILENSDDLDISVSVPASVYNKLYSEGAAMAGFEPGEKVTLYDLLHGILLPSGAEAAAAAAIQVAGSEEKFVDMMNEKALEMGLSNTRFENIYGFDDKDHYSNASELAQILMYAIENETFCEIAGKESYKVAPTNKHPDGFTMKSTVFAKIGGKSPEEAVILGGKTGFTYDAGLCLATYAQKGDEMYAAVVLGVTGTHRTPQYQVDDTMYLYNLIK